MKVDVLGLLDRCNASLDAANIGWPSPEEIAEGRAAIAELIEADTELDDLRNLPVQKEPVSGLQSRLAAAWARRRAALAKVQP